MACRQREGLRKLRVEIFACLVVRNVAASPLLSRLAVSSSGHFSRRFRERGFRENLSVNETPKPA